MQKKLLTLVLSAGLMGALAAIPASAQTDGGATPPPAAGGGQGGGQGGGRQRGNFDPAQFRQRMEDGIKEQLGTTDDEWKAIQPKLDKVLELQFQSRMGGMRGMFGGRGGRGGQGGQGAQGGAATAAGTPTTPTNPVAAATTDLRNVLDNKDAKPEEIKAKLTALRDARAKSKEELTKAQADLKELLTQRQEAVLVNMGMLE
jgi:hypothetical protein